MAAAPPSQHPVARVLRERAEAGSVPEARDDPHRVALVLEGGGMRGVVSAGMVAALETLGMSAAFDLVVGSSAGAINGAALLSGVATRAADAYCGPLASKSFVNPMRVLRGKPVIDVNDVLTIISPESVAGQERVTSGDVLHCIAVDVDSAQPVDLHGMRTQDDGLERDPGLEPDAVGGRPAGRDRRAPLSRRRHGLADPGRRGAGRGRHARARAADAPVRDPAQERLARRRPADRTRTCAASTRRW